MDFIDLKKRVYNLADDDSWEQFLSRKRSRDEDLTDASDTKERLIRNSQLLLIKLPRGNKLDLPEWPQPSERIRLFSPRYQTLVDVRIEECFPKRNLRSKSGYCKVNQVLVLGRVFNDAELKSFTNLLSYAETMLLLVEMPSFQTNELNVSDSETARQIVVPAFQSDIRLWCSRQ